MDMWVPHKELKKNKIKKDKVNWPGGGGERGNRCFVLYFYFSLISLSDS